MVPHRGLATRIASGPLTCGCFIGRPICHILIGNIRHQRVLRIRVREQRADTQKHFADCEGGCPLVFENIQTNRPLGGNVRMVNLRFERYFGRLERVIRREMDFQLKHTPLIGCIGGAKNHCVPYIHVPIDGARRAILGRILLDILEFLVQTTKCHSCTDSLPKRGTQFLDHCVERCRFRMRNG